MAAEPLLSIITVVRNGERDIGPTLQSLCAFHGPDVEILVIDGASTDATLAVVRGFEARIDVLVSEPDTGIYDAMNKGIARARGRFVLHINAGDLLLRVPRDELLAAPAAVAALSFPVRLDGGGSHVPTVGWRLRTFNTLHHQGTFYRRTPALRYDVSLPTFADFDLNQRLLHAGNVRCLPGAVALHRLDGVSNRADRAPELLAVILRNQGPFWLAMAWFLFKVRGLRQRIRRLARS